MTMSSRYGIRYSWYAGLPPDSGRYRFTRNTTSRSAMSVRPRDGLPLRDLHRRVIDARRAVRAIRERVLQVIHVVPSREVRAAVGAPRLPSVQSAMGDRRRDVEHEVELEDPGHLRVKHMVLVRQADGGESVPQLAEFPARVGEAGLVPEDSDVALHQLLHFDPHAREGLLPSLATHEAVEDASLLPPEGFARRGAEGTQVEAEVRPVRTLERAARFDLLDHRSGEDVPRPQLHLGRQVALHVALPVLVDQIATLPARRLRDQDARPREARRMELDHLHVLQRHAGAVGEGHAVACLDEAVRREFVHAAAPAGR